jgi:hypothetical protein
MVLSLFLCSWDGFAQDLVLGPKRPRAERMQNMAAKTPDAMVKRAAEAFEVQGRGKGRWGFVIWLL